MRWRTGFAAAVLLVDFEEPALRKQQLIMAPFDLKMRQGKLQGSPLM
jgi:hypothetical protein